MTLRQYKIIKLGGLSSGFKVGSNCEVTRLSSEKRIIMEMHLVSSRDTRHVHVSRYSRHSLQRVLDGAEALRYSGIAPGGHVSREGIYFLLPS